MGGNVRLDDLYKMTAAIYQDANLSRSREATFLHFVEVSSMLTMMHRKKNRDKVDMAGALCKALGWYFPLLAKMGVASVEDLIFSKYPFVCPYCRETPHREAACKLVKGAESTVDHDALKNFGERNHNRRPKGLNDWQKMFDEIYPRSLNPSSFSIVALFEEIGEIAESIRVFERHPHYFFGEAADAFSYIMGLANEFALQPEGQGFNFEDEYLSRYPGMCINCGYRVCACPPVPAATIGRMTKELDLDSNSILLRNVQTFDREGLEIGKTVFESMTVTPTLGRHLPFDRGDLNDAMMQLCIRLANALNEIDPELAVRLRTEAATLGEIRQGRGTKERTGTPQELLDLLRLAWSKADGEAQQEILDLTGTVSEVVHLFDQRILVLTSNPEGSNDLALRLDKELRAIRNAVSKTGVSERDVITHLGAVTIDDFLNNIRDHQYDIIHYSGHANAEGLAFMGDGDSDDVLKYSALASALKQQKRLTCVILNACNSLEKLSDPFAPLVVGMMDAIDDADAIAFSTGFYEALAARKAPKEAYDQGVLRVEAKDGEHHLIAKLTG